MLNLTSHKYLWIGAILVALLVVVRNWTGQPALGQTSGQVQMQIELAQTVFQVGEPVVAHLKIVNGDDEPILLGELDPLFGDVRYLIQREGGASSTYGLPMVVDPRTAPTPLAAGATRYGEPQPLHFNYLTDSLAFPSPGVYIVRAEYMTPDPQGVTIPPAEVSIEVVAANQPGADLFTQKATADFILGFSRDETVIQQLEALVAQQPDSLFSLYARYYLAVHAARPGLEQTPDL
jgi:hypothetical protein